MSQEIYLIIVLCFAFILSVASFIFIPKIINCSHAQKDTTDQNSSHVSKTEADFTHHNKKNDEVSSTTNDFIFNMAMENFMRNCNERAMSMLLKSLSTHTQSETENEESDVKK